MLKVSPFEYRYIYHIYHGMTLSTIFLNYFESCFIELDLLQKMILLLGYEKNVIYSKLVNNPFNWLYFQLKLTNFPQRIIIQQSTHFALKKVVITSCTTSLIYSFRYFLWGKSGWNWGKNLFSFWLNSVNFHKRCK